MSTLYLIFPQSHNGHWLYSALAAQKTKLEANNYRFVPVDECYLGYTAASSYIWVDAEKKPQSPAFRERLEFIKNNLDAGHDVILQGNTSDPACVAAFLQKLHEDLDSRHLVKAISWVQDPVTSIDHWLRLLKPGEIKSNIEPYIRLKKSMLQALKVLQQHIGEQNTVLLPDLSKYPTKASVQHILNETWDFLGMKGQPQVELPEFPHHFAFTSTGARLLRSTQVRDNDWPRIDNAQLMETLQRLEPGWFPDTATSLADRKHIVAEMAQIQTDLEALLKLKQGALAPPAWYETAPQNDGPLDTKKITQFVAELSPENRKILLERFANDEEFLDDDQKALRAALQEAQGYCHIGSAFEPPLLTVLTMTLNHEKYIGQCIEGVLAQKTDFPIQHLILDHYSTDGAPQIIEQYARDYPSIRPVLLHHNNKSYDNVRDLFIRCRSEYAALCDGDDYFTDPLKLQKQVDYLKANPACSICFHPVLVSFEDNEADNFIFPADNMLPKGERKNFYLGDLISGNIIQTNSAVYRWHFRDGLPEWFDSQLCPGDWYWHLLHAEVGKIGYLRDVMSVYRRHAKAAYNQAFKNKTAHSSTHGLAELHTFDVVNRHFKGRFQARLCALAAGIFNDYMNIFINEGSSRLLDEACARFPIFGKYYLSSLDLNNSKKGESTESN